LRAWYSSITASARNLWQRAKSERASPPQIGWSFGIGVWVGFSPFVGFHLPIAFALATVLRLNRLWAMVGTRVAVTPLLVAAAFLEVETAHRLRTGATIPIAPSAVLAHGRELFWDWLLGACLLATPTAVVLGLVAFGVARAQARRVTRRTPDEPRPPSSGSRPSAPPAVRP
jgi:uncharacterized protein (DUF2062 family)